MSRRISIFLILWKALFKKEGGGEIDYKGRVEELVFFFETFRNKLKKGGNLNV
jgi:hypothetical protein